MTKKIIAWIVYLIPVIGSLAMIWEAIRGKELTGTIIVGSQKTVHFLFGLLFLIIDIALIWTVFGGSIVRLFGKLFFRKAGQKILQKGTANALRKGFLSRGLRKFGFGKAGAVIRHAGMQKGIRGFAARTATRYAENKILRGTEHALGSLHGARIDSKKRRELEEQFGQKLNRRGTIEAQKAQKQFEKERNNENIPEQMAA